MKVGDLMFRFKRRWNKCRLQPIRVFCFHQTSERYEEGVYCKPDWIPTAFLKEYLEQLQVKGYIFISLSEAQKHINKDIFRFKRYAVLTADDGLLCQAELLPWLEERHIPITLFIDLETLDGMTCTMPVKDFLNITDKIEEQKHAEQLYLTLKHLENLSSPMLSIGMHGVKHEKMYEMTAEEFTEQINTCKQVLSQYSSFIPFFAYPYGTHSSITNKVLCQKKIVSVWADGKQNYDEKDVIHREILEYIYNLKNE